MPRIRRDQLDGHAPQEPDPGDGTAQHDGLAAVENLRRPNADVIGVGFGPSNLGLAVAIEEHNLAVEASGGRILAPMFFERQPDFSWHGGMLLETATVQVSFLKDLVTMRNPV